MEEKPQIKTGLFGGSFNPIHTGHLALANYLCEYGGLKMVEAAVAGYPRFRASDFEFQLPRPSYTIHTLDKLAECYPDREFHLIIGADNWQAFDRWRSPEEIIRRHHILVYPRQGYPLEDTASLPPHVRVVQTPLIEISSTFIRKGIREGKDLRYFLHPEVFRIIQEKGLYR